MTKNIPAHSNGRKWNSCRVRSRIICIRSARRQFAARLIAGSARCSPKARHARWERWTNRRCCSRRTAQLTLSWQTTVVGDPLYRPFGQLPEQLHERFLRENNPLIEWSFLRIVNATALRGTTAPQLIESLQSLPQRTNSAVLTEKLAELCDAAGKPSSAIDFYEKALQLNPSPQQKI